MVIRCAGCFKFDVFQWQMEPSCYPFLPPDIQLPRGHQAARFPDEVYTRRQKANVLDLPSVTVCGYPENIFMLYHTWALVVQV